MKYIIRSAVIVLLSLGFFLVPVFAQSSDTNNMISNTVIYRAHVQNLGWQKEVINGQTAGTTGKALGVEAIEIDGILPEGSTITAQGHVTDIGWMDPVQRGETCGTTGKNKRLEAVRISLGGPAANSYDIYYRTHVSNIGWLGWTSNGSESGSTGLNKPIEAIEIQLLPKGSEAPGSTERAYVYKGMEPISSARVHIGNVGWEESSLFNTKLGTTGQNHQLEAIELNYLDESGSGIEYITHLKDLGWEKGWKKNGQMSGTTGQNRRIEAIRIRLTGSAANKYDIYYQAHVANLGWLDWAKNGGEAGTSKAGLQMEALNIVLVPKGESAPGSTDEPMQTPISHELFRSRIHGCWLDVQRAENQINSYVTGISDAYMYLGNHQTFNGCEGYYEILSASTTGGKVRIVDTYTKQVHDIYIDFKGLPSDHLRIKTDACEREVVRGDTTDGTHYTFSGLKQYGQLAVFEVKLGP